jgi:arsenite methyltransferase
METLYRTRDVLRRRRLVREALEAAPGERILDVGCGPGFYLAEPIEQVGPTGSLVGIDASPHTLALARHRTQGHDNPVGVWSSGTWTGPGVPALL